MKRSFLKILSVFSLMCMFIFNINVTGSAKDNYRPKVSVIIPVYATSVDSDKYLKECLDSIINQTLKEIEIICVDDNSPKIVDKKTVDLGKILNYYAEKDNRIKVIHKSKNEGIGAARNTGLDNATGEYITFCDDDDYIHPKTYEYCYKYTENGSIDRICFNFRIFNKGQNNSNDYEINLDDAPILSLNEFWNNPNVIKTVWRNMFKYELIKNDNLKFMEDLKPADDTCFNFMYMAKAKKIKHLRGKFYNYRIHSSNTIKTMPKLLQYEKSLKLFKYVCDSWRERSCLKGNESLLLTRLIYWINSWNPKAFLKYSYQILNSFGTDIYNKEVIEKCPKKVQNIIKQLEKAAKKQNKMEKAA